MNRSQTVTRDRIRSIRSAVASLPTPLKRERASFAALLVASYLLLPVPASAQQADGERMFRQRCGACHSLEPGQNRAGPHLSGVVGRTAGSIEGARYSAAMRESGIVWDSQSLDAFLAAPRQVVPGTSMTVGVPDAAQRAAIVSHLESTGVP